MPSSRAKRPKKNSHTSVKIGPGDTLAGRFFGDCKQKENRQTLEVWRFSWWSIADFYAALRIPPTSKISSLPLEIFQSPVSHRYAVLVRFANEKTKHTLDAWFSWWSLGDSNP